MAPSPVINENGYANVTQDYFKPLWSSGLTLGNSIVFLTLYSIYMIVLVAFLIRATRKVKLKRNHKILFSMTAIFVIVQIILMVTRIVSDALQLESRIITERKELVRWDLFVAVQVFAGIITFFMLINFVILMVIMFFVQRMFWKTATIMRAISKNTSKIISIFMMIIEGLFIVGGTILVTVMSIIAGLKKFNLVPSTVLTAIFATAFATATVMIVFVALMVLVSGILVIKTIRQSSRNVLQAVKSSQHQASDVLSADSSKLRTSLDKVSFERRIQSPFKITFGLLIGLVICVILELIAIAVASIAADIEQVKLIWQALNCFAVLIFGVLIIFLFYPLFMDMESALNEIEKRKQASENKKLQTNLVSCSVGSVGIVCVDEMKSPSTTSTTSESPPEQNRQNDESNLREGMIVQ